MSDVARDSSGEARPAAGGNVVCARVASARAHGDKNGCGSCDAPLLKETEDCRSRARRSTVTEEWRCGGGRDRLPGAHFAADGGAHRRCVSAADLR